MLKHLFASTAPASSNPALVDGPNWNDDHYFLDAGHSPIGALGDLTYRGAGGLVSLLAGAQGLLQSAGSGSIPAYTMTPTVTSLTVTGTLTAGSIVLSGGGITIDAGELGVLDGVTPGLVTALKAVVVDANKDIATFRNLTALNLYATTITASGAITAGSIVLGGGSITIDGSELGYLDGVTPGVVTASKAIVVDANKDIGYIRNLSIEGTLAWSPDVKLLRDGVGVLAQRNGTNQQALLVYNTYTDAANFERGVVQWSANSFYIGTVNGGTGTARDMVFVTAAGAQRWKIGGATGHLLAGSDNTYDIGASGATRPRNVYVAGTITTATIAVDNLAISGSGLTIANTVGTEILFTGASPTNITSADSINFLAGAGTFISLGISGTGSIVRINATGLIFQTDNTFDIGASGATRPRNIYMAGALIQGATPAQSGAIRLTNGFAIYWRNVTNTSELGFYLDSANVMRSTAPTLHLDDASAALKIGTTPATGGDIRVRHGGQIMGRNSANTANRTIVDWGNANTDVLYIGDTANGRTTLQGGDISITSAGGVISFVNGTSVQTLRVYKTYTDASNYERLEIGANLGGVGTNTFAVMTRSGGTGVTMPFFMGTFGNSPIGFITNSTTRWWVDAVNGALYPGVDNVTPLGGAAVRISSAYINTLISGTNPAQTGAIRLPNAQYIYGRNAANTADRLLVGISAADEILIGSGSGLSIVGGSGSMNLGNAANPWNSLTVGGANAAAAGAIRMSNTAGIFGRNAANTQDLRGIAFSSVNTILLGNAFVPTVELDPATRVNWGTGTTSIGATSYGSAIATGTLVGNDAQTIASGAVISLGPNSYAGLLIVVAENANTGVFLMNGSGNSITLVTQVGVSYTTVAGTANRINLYWSAANSRYELQNNFAYGFGVRVIRLGL